MPVCVVRQPSYHREGSVSAAWVGPVGAKGRRATPGIYCPGSLAEALRAYWQRNLDDLGCPAAIPDGSALTIQPAEALRLDAPGIAVADDEVIRVELPGYAATCDLMQVLGVVAALDALARRDPQHIIDGTPAYELPCPFHAVVFPASDLPALLAALSPHVARSCTAYEAFAQRIAAATPHVHFKGLRPLPES